MKMTRQESVHPKRVPVSSNRAPLTVKGLDQTKYVARFVNDIEDRIAKFLIGGYQFVNRDKDGRVVVGEPTAGTSSAVDQRIKKPVGHGVTAYLMAIPREFYEEDQRNKEREIAAVEAAMKRPQKSNRNVINEEVDFGSVAVESKLGGLNDDDPKLEHFKR